MDNNRIQFIVKIKYYYTIFIFTIFLIMTNSNIFFIYLFYIIKNKKQYE